MRQDKFAKIEFSELNETKTRKKLSCEDFPKRLKSVQSKCGILQFHPVLNVAS